VAMELEAPATVAVGSAWPKRHEFSAGAVQSLRLGLNLSSISPLSPLKVL